MKDYEYIHHFREAYRLAVLDKPYFPGDEYRAAVKAGKRYATNFPQAGKYTAHHISDEEILKTRKS